MKNLARASALVLGSMSLVAASYANAADAASVTQSATSYVLTITNGSKMPLSPIAIYAEHGETGKTQVGYAPSKGFVQLCQTGDPSLRIQELGKNKDVTYTTQTTGLLMPGETRSIVVHVNDPLHDSIQIEGMYGKTKDVCAVGRIGSESLYALKKGITPEYIGKDNVLQTGAFMDPALPMGSTFTDANLCAGQADAISCLRSLAPAVTGAPKVADFSSYLASVQMLLETKYGASETQSLIIPSSGAVEFHLKMSH